VIMVLYQKLSELVKMKEEWAGGTVSDEAKCLKGGAEAFPVLSTL